MTYKESFIKFMAESGVLSFGEFTLKSGRVSPYFINTGNYKTGAQLAKLGGFYAECIQENDIRADALFGPAYKGIPLAASTAVALYNKYSVDMSYCFNRKEAKDHGEGGVIVGRQLQDDDSVIIIEDVITSGKALREVLPVLKSAANIDIKGMIISADRAEKGLTSDKSAVQEVYDEFGINIYPIVTINDIIDAIKNNVIDFAQYLDKMLEYRSIYGVN